MKKVIFIFWCLLLGAFLTANPQNYNTLPNENIFVDSSLLNIKLDSSQLVVLQNIFPKLNTKRLRQILTPQGDIYSICAQLNKTDRINFIIDRCNKGELIKFIEITKLKNGLKNSNSCDNVTLNGQVITSKGIFIGMSIKQFSNIANRVVFNEIYKYKDYWVFEYINVQNIDSPSRKQESMDLRPFQSEIYQHPDLLCSFGVKSNVFSETQYVSRYIFYGHDFEGYRLVKFSFGFQFRLPVNPFEGLLY